MNKQANTHTIHYVAKPSQWHTNLSNLLPKLHALLFFLSGCALVFLWLHQ